MEESSDFVWKALETGPPFWRTERAEKARLTPAQSWSGVALGLNCAQATASSPWHAGCGEHQSGHFPRCPHPPRALLPPLLDKGQKSGSKRLASPNNTSQPRQQHHGTLHPSMEANRNPLLKSVPPHAGHLNIQRLPMEITVITVVRVRFSHRLLAFPFYLVPRAVDRVNRWYDSEASHGGKTDDTLG